MNTKKHLAAALALSALVAAVTPLSAFADRDDWRHDHGRHERFEHREWHDRDYDARWHNGHWYHGYHEGRLGWWWVVAPGLWFWYAHSVYADPPPSQVTIIQPPAAAIPPPAPAPAAPQYWYYCKPARAYYPYVSTCPSGWQRVPATPAPNP